MWCFAITFGAATLGIFPTDEVAGTGAWYHVLALNIIEPLLMVAVGIILPVIAHSQRKAEN
jgi:hypothetical protein